MKDAQKMDSESLQELITDAVACYKENMDTVNVYPSSLDEDEMYFGLQGGLNVLRAINKFLQGDPRGLKLLASYSLR